MLVACAQVHDLVAAAMPHKPTESALCAVNSACFGGRLISENGEQITHTQTELRESYFRRAGEALTRRRYCCYFLAGVGALMI